MSLNLILALIIAAFVAVTGAAVVGYNKGEASAQKTAKIAMDEHLAKDVAAEDAARAAAQKAADRQNVAQNEVSGDYEKGKKDAEDASKNVVAGLRAGSLRLRDRWAACEAGASLPRPTPSPSEPDASTGDREASAGRIIQAAKQCDAQVIGLQNILRLERGQDVQQPQPEVGVHVGPLSDQNTGSRGAR